MLFHERVFIFLFLPATLICFYALTAVRQSLLARTTLVIASLIFYGFWKWSFLAILVASIGANYVAGVFIQSAKDRNSAKNLAILGIVANVVALAYYKYAGFIVSNTNTILGTDISVPHIILPLAISFFTFQQIAWLVDCYQGKVRNASGLIDYALFVSFFPQLIAGPIVHHSEMMPQFSNLKFKLGVVAQNLAIGGSIFIIGLFKKTVIADSCAAISTPAFDGAHAGISPIVAWTGLIAYTFQIYFDFSGYSDMAVGLGRMFGIKLPINFNSPYRAFSISDFWRRWHMTLSRFLRDYIYIPLGGNRKSGFRRYLNLIATMLIGGIWHGASWNFALWGAIHGGALTINHLWNDMAPSALRSVLKGPLGWLLTFLVVTHAWVFFRAEGFSHALQYFRAMYDLKDVSQPFAPPNAWPQWIGLTLLFACCLALFFENTSNIFIRYRAYLGAEPAAPPGPRRSPCTIAVGKFRPTFAWASFVAIALCAVIYKMTREDGYIEFIYFQF